MGIQENGVWKNEGIVKNKKTYFALLAHKSQEVLAAQIQNIRHYNPEAGIILYNGGTDPNLGKHLNTLIYPYSHPIQYGNLTPYFWEIMKWLEQCHVEYEYLINLDHDVLFVKHGFQDYIHSLMKDYDVMGWDMVTSNSPSDTIVTCCRDMWNEWDQWKPLFKTDGFKRYLNSTQVYRHEIVRRMVETTDHKVVEQLISASKVFALEEIFFVTLAASKGARIREYPREENWKRSSRYRSQISFEEAEWVREHPYYYWIHPVKDNWLIRLNNWLMGGKIPVREGDQGIEQEDSRKRPVPNAQQAGPDLEADAGITRPKKAASPLSKANKRKKLKTLRKSRRRPAGKNKLVKKRKLIKPLGNTLRKRKSLKPNPLKASRKKKQSARSRTAKQSVKRLKRSA